MSHRWFISQLVRHTRLKIKQCDGIFRPGVDGFFFFFSELFFHILRSVFKQIVTVYCKAFDNSCALSMLSSELAFSFGQVWFISLFNWNLNLPTFATSLYCCCIFFFFCPVFLVYYSMSLMQVAVVCFCHCILELFFMGIFPRVVFCCFTLNGEKVFKKSFLKNIYFLLKTANTIRSQQA